MNPDLYYCDKAGEAGWLRVFYPAHFVGVSVDESGSSAVLFWTFTEPEIISRALRIEYLGGSHYQMMKNAIEFMKDARDARKGRLRAG